MSERRFKELTPETMTPEQKKAADAIQAGPRGAGSAWSVQRAAAQLRSCAIWYSGSAPMCGIPAAFRRG